MTRLLHDLYLREPSEHSEVITWGKAPAITASDHADGISRFGGNRQPSYAQAYTLAARKLLESARIDRCLDDLGLPIFYLQRHALELLIKDTLEMMMEANAMELGTLGDASFPGAVLTPKLFTHNLPRLYELLRKKSELIPSLPPLPKGLSALVGVITKYEKTEVWSRFNRSRMNEAMQLNESAVPLVEHQKALDKIAIELGFVGPSENFGWNLATYWDALYQRVEA